MKFRLFVLAVMVALLLAMTTATLAQENTLEFMEQAILAETWWELGSLGEDYGVFTKGCECYGEIWGSLSVGGVAAANATMFVDEILGNAGVLTFDPAAYDAVKSALVERYGDPQAGPEPTWTFAQAEIRLAYSDTGKLVLTYAKPDFPALSLPTFPPPAVAAPARDPQAAIAEENTFAFLEQASAAESWAAMLELMRQYGLRGYETGCYADIMGDLSIGGEPAEVVMIVCGDHEDTTVYETKGYSYDVWFEPEAYDVVKEALIARYGEPQVIEEADMRLIWWFRQTKVCLWRIDTRNVVVFYYLQPTADETKPAFPAAQAACTTPVPAKEGTSSDAGDFILFMEQASQAYSREALGRIGAQYGLAVAENKHGARLNGSLAVDGHAVLRVDACSPRGLPGFECYAYFGPDAFDAVKAALTSRYGEPVRVWGAKGCFAWRFAEIDVLLGHAENLTEVYYNMRFSYNGFYSYFPPFRAAVALNPARMPQNAMQAEKDILEFMERVLQVESWEALEALGQGYGITATRERDYLYNLSGELSIAGFWATECDASHWEGSGFSCGFTFESDAYDAVLEALVNRYGDPKIVWGRSPSLVWNFRGARVSLYRSFFDGRVDLYYGCDESMDASLPTFPSAQPVGVTGQ